MRKATVFLVAICSLLLPFAAFAQLGSESDRKAIREVVNRFVDAWNSHDAHAFAEVFAEDADFTNWRGTGASGRAKIEQFHAPLFATIFKASTLKYLDIKTHFLRSDVAAVDVRWGMTGATNAQGKPVRDREGLLDFVITKDAGNGQLQ